jgi:rubrerythrin
MATTTVITQERAALLLAIAIERYNSRRFRDWAMRFRPYDPSVSTFFEELAQEELDHEQELRGIYFRCFNERAPDDISPPDELIAFVRGLDALKDHFFVINSYVAQSLLEMAIKIERYTQRFYTEQRTKTMDPELSGIYHILSEFEDEHEKILLERLEEEQINSIEHMVSEDHCLNQMQFM